MRDNTAIFIGRSKCIKVEVDQIKSAVRYLIDNFGVTDFISGGMGSFDRKCARAVCELKSDYPQIKNILIIPYPDFKVFNRECFDEIIFPEGFEKIPHKTAIIRRDFYMVEQARHAICYISHSWGGVSHTYEFAKARRLNIVSL